MPSDKDFTFIKNRQPRKDKDLANNFFVWQHHLAGMEPIEEIKRNKIIKDRLANRARS